MTTFELTNNQREFLGLDPIENHWERVLFAGDKYRSESILYFEQDTIKRHIVSTENKYLEKHFDEPTKERKILLPKTTKGKEKKLTASVLEQRFPKGVYVWVSDDDLTIGNYDTQTTFYSSNWENEEQPSRSISEQISEFVEQSPANHLQEISQFKTAKRKSVKFQSGDYFCFKLDRTNYGFGRILLDVNKIRKKNLIGSEHGLGLLMGPPLIIQLLAYSSPMKHIEISTLDQQPKLPADVMMDNLLLYGEYEVIGHRDLNDDEFEFPISYGQSIDQRRIVFLQWGLIHLELPKEKFSKYVKGEKAYDQNPYGYYSIGFRPTYDAIDVRKTLANRGVFDFANSRCYTAKRDLRNPINKAIKDELFTVFGLDPNMSYLKNCKLKNTILTSELIKKL